MKIFLHFVTVLFFSVLHAQNQLPLIPYPSVVQQNEGIFILNKNVLVVADNHFFETQYLISKIESDHKIKLKVKGKSKKNQSRIVLKLDSKKSSDIANEESYQLDINAKEVVISASTQTGLFYGIQTFLQLIPIHEKLEKEIQNVKIVDNPVFKWRGMHLDVVRHFYNKDFVKRYIDFLAMYKFNRFHWHLTDDQGWRIEIKKYPKLTEIGAWRKEFDPNKKDSIRYGGFYTQEDIKEIVQYASERHITIVPEIEMPGHAVAAIAAYPELSCTGKQVEVETHWGVFDNVYCPTETTFQFVEDVLIEVMELFPSETIHIGGDECPKKQWEESDFCQNLMREKGLKNEMELQSYFTQRVEKFINSHGRNIIGWDEILEGGLAPNAKVMSWRGTEGGIAAARLQHDVVMSPTDYCYFDYYQGDPKTEPHAIGGYVTLEKVYAYQPIPNELSLDEKKFILGAQANVWTEYITTEKHLEYMVFPRMSAMAEVVWGTSQPLEYEKFRKRVVEHLKYLDLQSINYSKSFINQ